MAAIPVLIMKWAGSQLLPPNAELNEELTGPRENTDIEELPRSTRTRYRLRERNVPKFAKYRTQRGGEM